MSSQDRSSRHSSHGNTVAAWAAVGTLILAALVMSIAVAITSLTVFLVGVVIAIGGLVLGKVLAMAGYGMPRPNEDEVTRGVR